MLSDTIDLEDLLENTGQAANILQHGSGSTQDRLAEAAERCLVGLDVPEEYGLRAKYDSIMDRMRFGQVDFQKDEVDDSELVGFEFKLAPPQDSEARDLVSEILSFHRMVEAAFDA